MADNNPWAGINNLGAIDQKLYGSSEPEPTPPFDTTTKQPPPSVKRPNKEVEKPEIMNSRNPESSPASEIREKPLKYSTLLYANSIKKIKLFAAERDIKDYEVLEIALTEFFQKHK